MAFNNDDILVLAKAGFTAEQIAALNMVGSAAPAAPITAPPAPSAPGTVSAPDPTPAPAPAPEAPAPAPVPAPAPAPAPAQGATVDDVLKAINGLTSTFQDGFLQGAHQPTPVTADQVLAQIINPPQKQST